MNFDSFNYTDFNTITNDQDFINSYIDLEKFNVPLDEDNTHELNRGSDFNNELYQIISNDSLTNTTISSPSSASINNYHFQSSSSSLNRSSQPLEPIKQESTSQYPLDESFDINSFLKNDDALNYLESLSSNNSSPLESIQSPIVLDQKFPILNSSNSNLSSNHYHNKHSQQYSHLDFQSSPSTPETYMNTPTSLASSTSSPSANSQQQQGQQQQNNTSARRNLSVSSISSSNSASSSSIKKNLDSRLSLQKLGEILQTSSLDETIKIEQFILKIFQEELGFPLGYKTWIRDTNEEYRKFLITELYNRVNPKYPSMTKNLLETVVKRATYSMMQGRLRKERRAAIKKRRN